MSSKKDLAQAVKRLKCEGLVVGQEPTKGQHVKLRLVDGTFYVCCSSPGDPRGFRNMVAAIRRTVGKGLAEL